MSKLKVKSKLYTLKQIISNHVAIQHISSNDQTDIKLENKRKHSKSIHNKLISNPPPQLHHQKYNRHRRNIIFIIMRVILFANITASPQHSRKGAKTMFHHASTLCHLT